MPREGHATEDRHGGRQGCHKDTKGTGSGKEVETVVDDVVAAVTRTSIDLPAVVVGIEIAAQANDVGGGGGTNDDRCSGIGAHGGTTSKNSTRLETSDKGTAIFRLAIALFVSRGCEVRIIVGLKAVDSTNKQPVQGSRKHGSTRRHSSRDGSHGGKD